MRASPQHITSSPLLPGHFGNLCSTSYLLHQWGVRNGTKGLIWGLVHCNQMRLLKGKEKEGVGYYVLPYIPLQHCCFFVFLSRPTLMLYLLTFVVLAAVSYKHRMRNILCI